MIHGPNHSVRLYNASGKNGNHGTQGGRGGVYGQRGQDGQSGTRGDNGRRLEMTLGVRQNHVTVQTDKRLDRYPLSDRNIIIAMQSRGGNGGHGGDGGAGAKGYKGKDGNDASRFRFAGDGEDGGPGGHGGKGGAGGDGGNGGDVILNVQPCDADLLMLTRIADTQGGIKGNGGQGGLGGRGGRGGRGGSSASWTTTDAAGQEHSHSRSGGYNGRAGANGKNGDCGKAGVNGQPGSFTICMGEKKYSRPYDLQVVSCKLTEPNKNGIFEPQKRVSAYFTVRNNGGMDLPRAQVTRVILKTNRYLSFDLNSTIFLPRGLAAGREFTPSDPLQFRIHDFSTSIGEPLNIKTSADFRATVERVERHFPQVEQKVQPFVVQYPAQMEKIASVNSISIQEEALMSVRLNNISNGNLGHASDANRIVTLKYRVLPNGETTASDVCFFSKEGDQCLGASGLTKVVAHMPAHTSTTLSGSLKFADPDLAPYTRVKIGVSLELGALTEPDNANTVKTVQRREFEVQLSDLYRYNPHADFLLVTNANTQKREMDNWRSLAGDLGLKFSSWNCSMYNGISFYRDQPVPDRGEPIAGPSAEQLCANKHMTQQTPLGGHFTDKTVVFLNYPAPDQKTSTDTLPSLELFHCAQAPYNLKFYTIGKAVGNRDQFFPDQLTVDHVRPIPLIERYFLCKRTSKDRLRRAAERHARRLHKEHPDKQFTVVYNYVNQRLPERHWGRKQHHVGDLKTCLAPNENMFIHHPLIPGRENQIDSVLSTDTVFGLFKSLSMAKKVSLVNNMIRQYSEEQKTILKKAILSDLVDEHDVFSRDKWTGSLGKKHLKEHLTTLRQVVDAHYESLHAQLFIVETLQEFRAFASRMPRTRDLFISRRQRILSSATKEKIDECLSRYYEDKKVWKPSYRVQKEYFKSIPRDQLWRQYQQQGITRPPLYELNGQNQVVDEARLTHTYNNPHPTTVVEQGHIYHSQKARWQALERLETTGKPLPEPWQSILGQPPRDSRL